MKENLLCRVWQNCFKPQICTSAEKKRMKNRAFSLVEMLMALLVASLLMAALAPVMTKRMDEAKINISGVGSAQYDKDAVIQIFNEDGTFLVPVDVNSAKVTMLGGGGAGGDAFHGVQEFKNPSSIQSWKVPDGVTKLRVYMVGGGGGGASGGVGEATAYGSFSQATETSKDFLTPGQTTWTVPDGAKIPELDSACKSSGVKGWNNALDNTDTNVYKANEYLLKVTACGGGGGGGGINGDNSTQGSRGGNGGYIKDKLIAIDSSTVSVTIGGGGGGAPYWNQNVASVWYNATSSQYGGGGVGGSQHTSQISSSGTSGGTYGGHGGASGGGGKTATGGNGSNGTQGTATSYGGQGGYYYLTYTYSGTAHAYKHRGGSGGRGTYYGAGGGGGGNNSMFGGGGGGGVTLMKSSENDVIIASGGGGGGGGNGGCDGAGCGTSGGGGGGAGPDSGGGGGGHTRTNSGHWSDPTKVSNISCDYKLGSGGAGAGNGQKGKDAVSTWVSGNGGDGGTNFGYESYASTIFGDNYCLGAKHDIATTGSRGKQGAMRISWGGTNVLKCDYNLPANGGGGGGAAQMTIGEIDVVPGETLYFEVGAGGGNQAAAGKNGNNGKATYIRRGSSTGTIIATALGGNAGQYSSDENVASLGGARLSKRVLFMVNNVENNSGNWINKTFTGGYGGGNGNLASALVNKGFGGAGGNIQNMKAEWVSGGTGGNSVKNGASPAIDSYGAGGGGGAGAQSAGDTFGIGAAGASGYIYIEYGGSNGGGGTSGEYISKTLYNLKPGSEIPITIGKGGKTGTAADGTVYDGMGEETSFGTLLKARGGLKGISGLVKDEHGGIKKLPDTYSNYTADEGASVHGHAGSEIGGGIGGNMEYIYQNIDNTYATFIKSKDGKIAGPPLGGCGGNMSSAGNCNAAASGAQGKVGVFGGGGGGGAVVDGVGGLGGYGGNGVVIIEYKSTSM